MSEFDDIKSLFEQDNFDLPSRAPEDLSGASHKLYKLQKVLDTYLGYWEEWKNSRGCFLSDREVLSIEYYRDHGTHHVLAKELGLSASRVSGIYNHALRRLQNNQHLFRHWIANKIFTQAGLHQQLEGKEEFLMRPMHEHKFSHALYLILSLEAENLSELLQRYNVSALLKLRGFGQRKLQELQTHLEKNGCLQLLRD